MWKGGVCSANSGVWRDPNSYCAFESTSCSSITSWSSSFGSSCSSRQKTNGVKIGRCSGDSTPFCTSVKENCAAPDSFDERHPDCTITSDSANFGSCVKKSDDTGDCVWGPNDCVDEETEFKAAYLGPPANIVKCESFRVKTGVCAQEKRKISGYHYYCVVSSKGCNGQFLTIEEANLNKNIKKTCFLFPKPHIEPVLYTKQKQTICHPDGTLQFESVSSKECESKCNALSSCKAYQVGMNKCILFSGLKFVEKGDKFRDYNCFEGKKKNDKALCDPRGIIKFRKDKFKKCRRKCKKMDQCKSFMTGPSSNCFLFEKGKKSRNVIERMEKKSFQNFDCYTLAYTIHVPKRMENYM